MPICQVPGMMYGSKPTDGGNFILTEEERQSVLKAEPSISKYIRPFMNAKEYLSGERRYCLWLVDANPTEIKNSTFIQDRVQKFRAFRLASVAKTTRDYPHHTLFRQVTQPSTDYILVPSTSSERRKYIPFGYVSKEVIISNASFSIEHTTGYHFGVLLSEMHMAWVNYTCGRLESRYRYSKDIVYNNYPWPENPAEKQKKSVEDAAQAVLDARAQFPDSSLADLYDPNTMPPALVKAHQQLDKAVDLCYRPQPFTSEAKRIEYLFDLYEKYTGGLFQPEKKSKKKQTQQ
jgi:hypothetical protein